MRQTASIDRFLSSGGERERVVVNNLITMFRGLGRLLLGTLQAVGFTTLAMFGAWPALAYLIYMAMNS